ncbi:MAG: carbon-nitrogen family hydrolase [Dehalococcoidia bacterium]|nr:carbon-nitrogen family hydrolase [Dehalococcoidia bacterium]
MSKVASIQCWFTDEDSKEDRIRHVEELIDRAADADLILLPEVWNIGWYSFEMYHDGSETLQGETISRLAEKASAVKAYILAGSIVERADDGLYNTAVLLDPKGKIIATYRKMHLFNLTGSQETVLLKRGRDIVAVKTELGVLGLSICYDLRFPELYRKMAINKGVEVFLLIAAWPLVRLENWVELGHTRANENQCYLISCNCAGFNRGNQYLGHSAIVNPHGVSIASGGIFECIVRGEIDIAEVYKFRKEAPHLQNRILPV